MRAIYNLLLILLFPLWAGYTLWRVCNGSWRERWQERFGWIPIAPPARKERIWLHTVSVGELLAALPVLKRLRESFPDHEIVLTTTTPTGMRAAQDSARPYMDHLLYFPLDLPFAARRSARRIGAKILLLFETELWLNTLYEQKRQGGQIVVLNGRISDRSMRRAQRGKAFFQAMLRYVDQVCAQSELDAARFVKLGMNPKKIEVTGNTKFDQAFESADADPAVWRDRLNLSDDSPVIVVGSTRATEEEQLVIEAYSQVRQQMPEVSLILAPRHLERVEEVAAQLREKGFQPVLRSALVPGGERNSPAVIIVDSFGELARLYSVATVTVIGGGFVSLGGQNVFQPLAHGKPVFFGPHMHNFRDISRLAISEGVGFEVDSADQLAKGVLDLLTHPERLAALSERASEMIARHQGASERCLQVVRSFLGVKAPPSLAL